MVRLRASRRSGLLVASVVMLVAPVAAAPVAAAPVAAAPVVAAPVAAAVPALAVGAATGPVVPASVFVLPVAPPPLILTPFTAPAGRYGAGHRGVDLAAAVGAPVLAAGTGIVVFAGTLAGRGVLSVEHAGGLRTTYEPVAALVTAGDRIVKGQRIGSVQAGHPGCTPASCLHWGARLPDRVYLDPMSLLEPWRVRLLPWEGP